jgi:dynein light chain roadblock-type
VSSSDTEVDEIVKRLTSHKGVHGVVIANNQGATIKSTLDDTLANKYSALFRELISSVKHIVQNIDPADDLALLRVRTKKHEIVISSGTLTYPSSFLLSFLHNPLSLPSLARSPPSRSPPSRSPPSRSPPSRSPPSRSPPSRSPPLALALLVL